nr:hypothetical protein Itr_chr11CG18940 [Ipomoea trifida]
MTMALPTREVSGEGDGRLCNLGTPVSHTATNLPPTSQNSPRNISLPINLPFLVAMNPMVVNSDVDVSVIEERLPRITRNKRLHEAMEISYLRVVLLVEVEKLLH